jgi:hypothetical protein
MPGISLPEIEDENRMAWKEIRQQQYIMKYPKRHQHISRFLQDMK